MNDQNLSYLSENKTTQLKLDVIENIDCYKGDGFQDCMSEPGWGIEFELKANLAPLQDLLEGKGCEIEVKNSLLVWQALHEIPESFATEDRFWTRLSHVECFHYSKARWLDLSKDDEKISKDVTKHFFASSLTKYRDDHAIGRLWWNAYVAKMLMPHDQELALNLVLAKADIRSNLIERPLSFGRPDLGRALLDKMLRSPTVYETEYGFRAFMKQVNKLGGGIVFEARDLGANREFMDECWIRAEAERSVSS